MGITDVERRRAAERAAQLWRQLPGSRPKCHYMNHRCAEQKCAMIEIGYAAAYLDGRVLVTLSRADPSTPGLIDQLPPIFGCPISGQVHACGEECDRRAYEITCAISGLAFEEEQHDGWWAPYEREGRRDWKMNVFGRGANAVPPVGVRDRIALDSGAGVRFPLDLIEATRKRARLRGKSEAFDVAFAIASIVLSDERFEDAIRRLRQRRAKMFETAKRAASHAMQRSEPVNASALLDALPVAIEPVPVLVLSRARVRREIVRYAENCVALWHLMIAHADAGLRDMSFRDFCASAMNLFGKGHNVPSWRTGRDAWVVRRDPLLNAFPPNAWVERKIYSEVRDSKKISGIMRRAEGRIKEALDAHVSSRDADAAYLRYADLDYDAVPEASFVDVKR